MNKVYKNTEMSLRECISNNRRVYCSVMTGVFILVILSLLPRPLLAMKNGKIVVFNSDTSVERYSIAHTVFKSKIGNLVEEIDLGNEKLSKKKIKKKIRKIDPDVIYCIGSKAYQLVHKVAKNKNVIFSSTMKWQLLPIGKNTYGVSNEIPQSTNLMMYRYFFPDIKKIGVLYSKSYNKKWLKIAKADADKIGVEIIGKAIRKPEEVVSALKELLPKVDALWLTIDPIVLHNKESVKNVFMQSEAARKPVFAYSNVFASYGAVLILSADISTIGKQAAVLALDILENQEITEKIQNPVGSSITLNMKKVKEYGITLNEDALDSVNEIIR